MKYFKECNTLDDAKNLFKKLCFKLHPDTSGYNSHADFIQMFKEFKNFTPAQQYARDNDQDFNAEAFYNIVKRFEGLKNVLVSFVGSFIWLEDEPNHEGSTKDQKEEIKKIIIDGLNPPRFAFKRKKWYYSPEGYRQKFSSNKSFDELKRTWGSKTYQPRTEEKNQRNNLNLV